MKAVFLLCGFVEVVYFNLMDFGSFYNVADFMDNFKVLFDIGSIMLCFESNISFDFG